jgi:hypothetical protein
VKRALWPASAGLVGYARSRATGTIVGVYNGAAAGLDTADGAEPWTTVCEDHAGVCAHRTRALAMSWASHPDEWCPICQITDERKDDHD